MSETITEKAADSVAAPSCADCPHPIHSGNGCYVYLTEDEIADDYDGDGECECKTHPTLDAVLGAARTLARIIGGRVPISITVREYSTGPSADVSVLCPLDTPARERNAATLAAMRTVAALFPGARPVDHYWVGYHRPHERTFTVGLRGVRVDGIRIEIHAHVDDYDASDEARAWVAEAKP